MMTKLEKRIVHDFLRGDSVYDIVMHNFSPPLSRYDVEETIRKALKAQDKKKR